MSLSRFRLLPAGASLALPAALMFQVVLVSAAARSAPPVQIIKYESSGEDFANPERGFFVQRSYNPARPGSSGGALAAADLAAVRAKGITLVRMLYSLRQFRTSPIAPEVLEKLSEDFARARAAGFKVIPRFSYSSAIGQPDASIERILEHIGQLKPVLRANADVVAFFEAGFAGAWGEWHSSTNGLFDAGPERKWPAANAKTRAILDALLDALPKDRMIALRCPRFKWQFFGETALSPSSAFGGTPQARTGAINDCLLASADDMGTYTDRIAEEKAFLHQDNLFVPQGGETCSADAAAGQFIACSNALAEMEKLRYSTLNLDYNRRVLAVWEKGGCMPEIRKRMGYRFRLLEAAIPGQVRPGGTLRLSFTVLNEGWANLYNPHPVRLLVRHSVTGKIYSVSLPEDPRLWMPGKPRSIPVEAGIPKNLERGSYNLLLDLPDAAPGLNSRPEYAVRFANRDAWEPAAGMNSLLAAVEVTPKAKGPVYRGKAWLE